MRLRVMIVADEWPWGSAMAHRLAEAGMQVDGCLSSPPGGSASVWDRPPDAVVVEQSLPGGRSGLGVMSSLGAGRGDVARILVLERVSPDRVREAVAAGSTALVARADVPGHLAAAVVHACNGAPYRSPLVISAQTRQGPDPHGLSPRDREIIGCLRTGMGTPEIAARLGVGQQTVRNRVHRIGLALGVSGRLQIVAAASERGLESAA